MRKTNADSMKHSACGGLVAAATGSPWRGAVCPRDHNLINGTDTHREPSLNTALPEQEQFQAKNPPPAPSSSLQPWQRPPLLPPPPRSAQALDT